MLAVRVLRKSSRYSREVYLARREAGHCGVVFTLPHPHKVSQYGILKECCSVGEVLVKSASLEEGTFGRVFGKISHYV